MEFPIFLVDGDNYLDRRNLPLNTVVPKRYDGWRLVCLKHLFDPNMVIQTQPGI